MIMLQLQHFFDPIRIIPELIYTIIIVSLCFLIYYKTKDIYDLTKHKGIHYFRNIFVFFGLAYLSRFILLLFFTATTTLDMYFPKRIFMPIVMIPISYLSTMALFYLMYSLIWRKIKYKHFLIFSNSLAVIFSIIAFISTSPMTLFLLQSVLIILIITAIFLNEGKNKKVSKTKLLYVLILFFWVMNVFVLVPKCILSLETKIVFQILSIIIFVLIYYKVAKWVK